STGLEVLAARGISTAVADDVQAGSFDVAVECTGNAQGFAVARQALRPRGTLVMKSTYADDLCFNASALVVDEITLVGSRCGPFPPALRLLEEKRVDVEPLIEARYPLRDAMSAFEHARRPGALKVLLQIADE
ncbi:MAG: zinc-binding dehydrogenase, partial [Anaerolineales bacterium]